MQAEPWNRRSHKRSRSPRRDDSSPWPKKPRGPELGNRTLEWLQMQKQSLPSLTHAYALELERSRLPVINVLGLSTAAHSRSRDTMLDFPTTAPVLPGVESGFCAAAVAGLRETLRLCRLVGHDPNGPVGEMVAALSSAVNQVGGPIPSHDRPVVQAIVGEWSLYQELVLASPTNRCQIEYMAKMNAALLHGVFGPLRLVDLCSESNVYWKQVDTTVFWRRHCCLPYLGITTNNYSSADLARAVLHRKQIEHSGEAAGTGATSPLVQGLAEQMERLARETAGAAQTHLFHLLWSDAQELARWVRSAAAADAPKAAQAVPGLEWALDPKGGVWSTVANQCRQDLAQFLSLEEQKELDTFCQTHASLLDQVGGLRPPERELGGQSPPSPSEREPSLQQPIENPPKTSSSDFRGYRGGLNPLRQDLGGQGPQLGGRGGRSPAMPSDFLSYLGGDGDFLRGLRETSDYLGGLGGRSPPDATHHQLLERILSCRRDYYMSVYVERWRSRQNAVLQRCQAFTSKLPRAAQERLSKWERFLNEASSAIPPNLYAKYTDKQNREALVQEMTITAEARRKWWMERTARRRWIICAVLYRRMRTTAFVPHSQPDRRDSLSSDQFDALLRKCISWAVEDARRCLSGERQWVQERLESQDYAPEIGFFRDGIDGYRHEAHAFQRVCVSGQCCSHSELIRPRDVVSDSSDTDSVPLLAQLRVGDQASVVHSIWDARSRLLETVVEAEPGLERVVAHKHPAGASLSSCKTTVTTALSEPLNWLHKFASYLVACNIKLQGHGIELPDFVQRAQNAALDFSGRPLSLAECLGWLSQCTVMVSFIDML